ncbi:MAG: winged helix-turn-helix domain-containing protein [Thermoplasmata archaeon]
MNAVRRLLWWLVAASEGGFNRARIITTLKETPCNANQLSLKLNLDYKTIRHHLDVLEKNNLTTSTGIKHGKVYFLSNLLEENYSDFEEIWVEVGQKQIKSTENKGEDKNEKTG